MALVLRHQIEVDQCPDVCESTFERDYLCTCRLAECHGENSQNTAPEIAHLFPLPLRNFTVGFFGDQESRVWRECLANVIESLQSSMFLQKAFDPVQQVLE